ncbi:hypothetical protein FACS1894199_18120 [Bacteroidia bacterium]|nr:hypothetical protein FACS1894199_18120 [Bacteroidia bacterium]
MPRLYTFTPMNIRGRLTFNGSGDYTYVNQDKLKIPIRFTSIGADTARLIYASINFTVEDDFKLNKGFIYKGEMRLQSRHPDMCFNGFVRMTSDSLYLKHSWLKTRTHLVASDIRILSPIPPFILVMV